MFKYIHKNITIFVFNTIINNVYFIKFAVYMLYYLTFLFNVNTLYNILNKFQIIPKNYIEKIEDNNDASDGSDISDNERVIFYFHGGAFLYRVPYNVIAYKFANVKNIDKYYCTYPLLTETKLYNKSINILLQEFIFFIKTHHYNEYIFIGESAGCSIIDSILAKLLDMKLLDETQIKVIFMSPFCIYPSIQFDIHNIDIHKDYLNSQLVLRYIEYFKEAREFGNPKNDTIFNYRKLKCFIIYGEHEYFKPSIKYFTKKYNLNYKEIKDEIHSLYFYKNKCYFDKNNLYIENILL